jgi:mono/diheme cytochrome c family protein
MMLALTQAQGIVLAIGGAVLVAVAAIVLVVRGRSRDASIDIPNAMRPGPSDPDLETPLLQKLQGWGLLLILFFVIWIPATWLAEPDRNLSQEQALLTDSIKRGSHEVQLFGEENQGGLGCVQCHGSELQGSRILNTTTNTPILTPNLQTVCGGPYTGHNLIYGIRDIVTTISEGRGQMPSWSIRFEGALNDQQINDLVNYLVSIQDEQLVPFDKNLCTNPDAVQAAIDEFLNGDVSKKPSPTDNVQF